MPAPIITCNPSIDDRLLEEVVDLWARVTNAGGAVGFAAPVEPADILPTARAELARVEAGLDDLVAAREDGRLIAFGFLATSSARVTSHVGTLKRLQRDPDARGRGIGAAVLAEVERAAWRRDLEVLVLTARSGTGRERFYLAAGYRLDGELPDRLKVDGRLRGELQLSKRRPGLATPVDASGAAPGVGARGELLVQRMDATIPLPSRAHPGDAGLDLHAAQDVELAPGQREMVGTGLAIAVPEGCVGLVHPRSGLAARHGLGLVNAPGTIDAGYRGEVKVLLVNHDPTQAVHLARGERIAQLVVQRFEDVGVVEVDELPSSQRGEGGFGSTGR